MSIKKPTVSLLISTYNWPSALKLVLESVTYQTVLPTEVLIADDGSKEDTKALIDSLRTSFPCPLIHIWHEDTGFRLAAIRNKTIAKASCEYLIQIDGDVILNKNFIKDHLSVAQKGCFVSGSRVKLTQGLTDNLLANTKSVRKLNFFSKGMRNKLNVLRNKRLRNYFKFRYKFNLPLYVKGCNMAFWLKDLLAVNGYNEDIEGWGAEDSEIAARFIRLGKKRLFVKMGAVQYHLEHPFQSRDKEEYNYTILLKSTLESNLSRIEKGIDQYL